MEEKRLVKMEDIDSSSLSEEELVRLFVILHSYTLTEYTEENVNTINGYIKHRNSYLFDVQRMHYDDYYNVMEAAWFYSSVNNVNKLRTKLFFWSAVREKEWYQKDCWPEYNSDNLKKLFMHIQRRFIVGRTVIDGEAGVMGALSNGNGDSVGY